MAIFGLIFLVVFLVLIGIGLAIGLVALAVTGAFLIAGVFSTSALFGFLKRSPMAGLELFLLQIFVVAGTFSGAGLSLLLVPFMELGMEKPIQFLLVGASGGLLAGTLLALCLQRLIKTIRCRLHSKSLTNPCQKVGMG